MYLKKKKKKTLKDWPLELFSFPARYNSSEVVYKYLRALRELLPCVRKEVFRAKSKLSP